MKKLWVLCQIPIESDNLVVPVLAETEELALKQAEINLGQKLEPVNEYFVTSDNRKFIWSPVFRGVVT